MRSISYKVLPSLPHPKRKLCQFLTCGQLDSPGQGHVVICRIERNAELANAVRIS
jgi:hypothetical protein